MMTLNTNKQEFIKAWERQINILSRLHNSEADLKEITDIQVRIRKVVNRIADQDFADSNEEQCPTCGDYAVLTENQLCEHCPQNGD